MTKPQLLGISGSLRRGSTNTAVLEALGRRLEDRGEAELRLFPLHEVPLYDGDLDGERPPPPVVALKQAIQECGGLVLCSPEYNHGPSGVLKNAIDWASRPGLASPLKDKPVLLMTCSPGLTGGVRAHAPLRIALASCLSRVVATREVTIGLAFQKMVDGTFADEPSLDFAVAAVGDLIAEMRR